jgi:Ca2+-binding EF-hand superfamily protein
MSQTGFGSGMKDRESSYERDRGMSPVKSESTLDRAAMSLTGFGTRANARLEIPIREPSYERESINPDRSAMPKTGFSSKDIVESGYGREFDLNRISSPKGIMSFTGFGASPKARLESPYNRESILGRGRVASPKVEIERQFDRAAMTMTGFGVGSKVRIDRENSMNRERVSSPKADIDRYSGRVGRISSPKQEINRYADRAERIYSPKQDIDRSINGYDKFSSSRVPNPNLNKDRTLENNSRISNPKTEIDRLSYKQEVSTSTRLSNPKAEIDRTSGRGETSVGGRISSPKPNINSRLDLTSSPTQKPISHTQSFTESYCSPHRTNLRSPSFKPAGATSPLKSSLRNTNTGSDDLSSSYRRSFAESVRFSPTLEISAPQEYSANPPTSRPRLSLKQESSSLPESELANIFRHQINHFRDLEDAKVALASRPDFNTFDGYRLLDPQDKNYISALDLEDRLKELGVTCIQDEHILLMKHYSSHKDLRLRYYDFCDMVNPKNEQYAKLLVSRNSSGAASVYEVFTKETLDKIANTFRLFLEAEIVSERLRQNLENNKEFSLYDAFKAVDKDKNGFITLDEFETILADHGVAVTHKDLLSLMERYDKNRDGRVSYSEFVQEITPKSPKRY